MRVLVVGSGGREHALVARCAAEPDVDAVLAAPGNPGIASLARLLDLDRGTLSGTPTTVISNIDVEGRFTRLSRPFFTASRNGVIALRPPAALYNALAWYDRRGAKLREVPPGGTPTLSPDEKRLSIGRPAGQWLVDLERSTAMPFLAEGGLTAWSPDGKSISMSLPSEIVEFSADDASKRRTVAKVSGWLQQYSPDGKSLLYVNPVRTTLELVSLDGKQPPIEIAPPGPSYFPAQFSPDARYVSYTSSESGRLEIYVRAVPPATGKWLISNNGGGMAAWRGDGKELFYLSNDFDMMAVDVTTSPTFKAGVPRVLFRANVSGNNNGRNNYVVSKDGQRFLIVSPTDEQSPISVVVNWPSLLNAAQQ